MDGVYWWFQYGRNPGHYDCPAIQLRPDGSLRCYPGGSGQDGFVLDPREVEEVIDAASDRAGFGSCFASVVLLT